MSIRLKILLLFSVSAALFLAYIFLYFVPVDVERTRENLTQTTKNHLSTVGESLVPFLLQNQFGAIYNNLDVLLEQNPAWTSIELYNKRDTRIYPLPGAAKSDESFTDTLRHTIRLREHNIGRLVLTVNFKPQINDNRERHLHMAELLVAGFILILFAIGFLLDVFIGKPIKGLVSAANLLVSGNFDTPLPKPRKDEIGSLVRTFSTMRDSVLQNNNKLEKEIEERKKSGKALKDSKKNLQKAQEIALLGDWQWDLVTDELTWSDQTYRIFGYDPGEITPSHDAFRKLIHPADRERLFSVIEKAINKNEIYNIEYRILRKDGTERVIHSQGELSFDDNNKPIRFFGINHDITALRKTEQALLESELWMRSIFSSLDEAVLVVTPDRTIKNANEATQRMFGYSAEELKNSSTEMLHVDHRYYVEFGERIQRAFDKGQTANLEFEGKRKNGKIFPTERTVSLLKSPDGELKGMVSVIRDISIRKQAEKTLEEASCMLEKCVKERTEELETANKQLKREIIERKQAEAANKTKSVFLSSMSHEIRTPLNAVIGFSQLLSFDTKDPLTESQKKKLSRVMDAGNHLLNLINDVLDLSKIESEKIEVFIENIDVRAVAMAAMAAVEPLVKKHEIKLVRKKMPEDYYVKADRTRLLQVLTNLLSNAIKYNRKNGEVALSWELADEKTVRINVSDTGPGIPEDKFEALFQPFDRLGMEGLNVQGSGIGLTIVKHLMESMKGGIGLESEVGKGARFYLDLPIGEKMKPRIDKADTGIDEPELKSPGRQHLVLYVEDDDVNIELMRMILERRDDIHMLSAKRVKEGIELARSRKPDLILMDISMPDMNGIEALNLLKKYEKTRDIPVVTVSGRALKHEVEEGRTAGFADYITKPIDMEWFFRVLDRFLA